MNRRRALKFAGFAAAGSALISLSRAATGLPRPDQKLLQSGDFVWPKKPGAYVPYNSGSINDTTQDRELWAQEKLAYLQASQGKNYADALTEKRSQFLRELDYREFIAVYAGAQKIGQPGVYSGGSVYVGHVGMITKDTDGVPWVIEALMPAGVVRVKYVDWIAGRPDAAVWLGRLKGVSADQRGAVSIFAENYIGAPYNFWNFDLNDDSSFYCSKLAWLSCYRTLHIALDGDMNHKRMLWFSPKQFLNLPILDIIHDPGTYAY